MSTEQKNYSPFWALLIFFGAAFIFDLNQAVKVHRQKLEVMQQYAQALQLAPKAEEQRRWIFSMREDLLRLAPGHPEASRIVAELRLRGAAPGAESTSTAAPPRPH